MNLDLFERICEKAYNDTDSCFTLEEVLYVFETFFEKYEKYRGEPHPPLKIEQIKKLINLMPDCDSMYTSGEILFDCNVYPIIMEKYFHTDFYEDCNYRINHFFSGQIRELLMYDCHLV